MRHLRIPGHNIKNVSSFKSQIGGLLKQINKFGDGEKTEALSYLQNCIDKTSSKPKKPKKKKRTQPTNDDYTYRMLMRRRLDPAKIKNKSSNCDTTTIMKNGKLKSNIKVKKVIYKCKVCSFTQSIKKVMLRHLETHVGAPLSCLKCKQTFNGSVSFSWHLTYFCRRPFHMKWKYKCNQCPREFLSKRNLNGHLQGHKRNNCTYCDTVFTRQIHLMRHLLEVHQIRLERTTYKCSDCEKSYVKKRSLYYHMKQHLPDKSVCIECGHISDTKDDSDNHKSGHDLHKHFTCSKCGEKFLRRQQYLHHLKIHDRYKCITCNESFASRDKILIHRKQGHKVEGFKPKFICPHCPLAFHRQNYLFVHLKKHNESNRNINCKYCKKNFSSPYAYYKHCITISHEKFSPEMSDLNCKTCGKHFVKKYDLNQHMYNVHNETKDPFVCEYCPYKSVHKCNMDRHVALHFKKNEFTCEHCGKTCDSLPSLKGHISYNHRQGKQFQCDKCDKSFKRNSELIRHQNTHSDERPHSCDLCEKSFKRVNHLKRHLKAVHQIVMETRRIKKIELNPPILTDTTSESPIAVDSNTLPESSNDLVLISSSVDDSPKLVVSNNPSLQMVSSDGNIFISLPQNCVSNCVNVVEQIIFKPERNLIIDNNQIYVYDDVALNSAQMEGVNFFQNVYLSSEEVDQ